MSDFLHMGGYAAYVWSAYGIATIILGINLHNARSYYRKQLKRASAQQSENRD